MKGWEIWGNPARYSTERKIDHMNASVKGNTLSLALPPCRQGLVFQQNAVGGQNTEFAKYFMGESYLIPPGPAFFTTVFYQLFSHLIHVLSSFQEGCHILQLKPGKQGVLADTPTRTFYSASSALQPAKGGNYRGHFPLIISDMILSTREISKG